MNKLEKALGYTFKDASLLQTAVTHSSYCNGDNIHVRHNERMEYLGDAVLGMCAADYIYTTYKNMSEGDMSRIRALSVCEDALFKVGSQLGIDRSMRLGKSEKGRVRPSIIADATEAVVAGVYLDGGIDAARALVLSFLPALVEDAATGVTKDAKTRLQELLQMNGAAHIVYSLVAQQGPDHDKTFVVEVLFENKRLGIGQGKSKKHAEQQAAANALLPLEKDKPI